MASKWMTAALSAVALVAAAGSAFAAPVQFNVSGGSFTVGSGYGTGTGQLDATFTSLVTPQSFSLANVGDVQSFLFGRVQLNEGSVSASELDNLGVTANLNFTSPLSVLVQNVAVTGAFVGTVNGDPNTTDYYINFSPVTVSFPVGGSFVVDIGDMFFNRTGPISNGANVILTAAPVPEPASMALLGAGLLGLGLVRRKKIVAA